jgi:hypothetical protein
MTKQQYNHLKPILFIAVSRIKTSNNKIKVSSKHSRMPLPVLENHSALTQIHNIQQF